MSAFWRLFVAERKKLRGSPLLQIVWLLPLLFILLEFFFVENRFLGIRVFTEQLTALVDTAQIKMSGALWGGFFYPILIALLPALIFRIEHRNSIWKHLGTMPVPQSQVYLVKALWVVLLSLASLVLVWFFLLLERSVMQQMMPVTLKFHGLEIAILLGWLWLGSLPVMGLYLWISNRINSLAIPIVFGVVGILLSIALTSQENPEPWKRDFNPWVTPHICVLQALEAAGAGKKTNLAGELFQEEPDILRLPSGKKVKTWQNIPDDELFPPPPPTPRLALASYSIIMGLTLLILGAVDNKRCRN